MFPNLEAEMARKKMTQAKLADILKITPTTLSFKLNGKSTLSLKECVEIKRKAFPDKTLDYLFATEEDPADIRYMAACAEPPQTKDSSLPLAVWAHILLSIVPANAGSRTAPESISALPAGIAFPR